MFGRHDFAVRISDYIFALGSCAAIYLATARQAPHVSRRDHLWIAPLATILLALIFLSLGLADTAQTESYSLLFLIGASLLVQSPRIRGLKRQHLLLPFLSGILLGIATFLKTSNIVFVLAIIAEISLYSRRKRTRTILFMMGGFALWCVLQLAILALSGSLTEFIRISVSVVLHHTKEVSEFSITEVPQTVWTYVDLWSIITLLAIAIAVYRRHVGFLRAALSPFILLLAGVLAVLIQNKGWGYQYVVILPGLARLIAISGAYLYHFFKWRAPKAANPAAALIIAATLFISPSARRRIHYTLDAVQSVTNHSAYLAKLGSKESVYYPLCTDSLARYFDQHTTKQDRVFIFGDEPGAYWRADRLPATRFLYSLLFTSGVIAPSTLHTMEDSLARIKPALIVIEQDDTTHFRGRPETSASLVQTDPLFRPLKALILDSYLRSDSMCGKFIVYRRHT